MNIQRLEFRERRCESLNTSSLNPPNTYFKTFGSNGASLSLDPMPSSMPSTVSSCVGSTPAEFFAAECLMGLPYYKYGFNTLPLFYQLPRNSLISVETSSNRTSELPFSANSVKRDMLDSIFKFPSSENEKSEVSSKFHKVFHKTPQEFQLQSFGQSKQASEECITITRHQISAQGVDYTSAGRYTSRSSAKNPNFQKPTELASVPIVSTIVSRKRSLPKKTRIRWTRDLHENFVESVNRLGGAEKATPKGILKLMASDGLTIYHIKSHLQKYRNSDFIPDEVKGKSARGTSIKDRRKLDPKIGLQIMEALHLQLDVQNRLHEQLEIQQNLQSRIEAQGRKLQKMFEEQLKANRSLHEPQKQ